MYDLYVYVCRFSYDGGSFMEELHDTDDQNFKYTIFLQHNW